MKIIAAFPGTGKTTFTKNADESLRVVDNDSAGFPKENFPANYIEHIRSLKDQGVGICFVSTHKAVREALIAANMPFYLVYPTPEQKDDYMSRYRIRGSDDAFISLMDKEFENFIDDCMKQAGCTHVVLNSGAYIPDALETIKRFVTPTDY